ncbi:BppU family phage baseplate upper protein [Paraclostridium sordellii]|uniref:BppU family phage baseplate upper protein n=1 Tax=Paraclostridium sordellii TaxID=1505 RepID=UPI0030D0AFF9
MAINNFHFKLDIEREDHIPKFRLKQYDTAIFYASLYKNGLPYHFENEKIKMFVKKADGTIVYQEDNISIQDDEVKINVKNQALTASGLTYAELELKSSTGQVTTATFLFEVKKKVGSDDAIESITDISTLEKIDKYVGQAKKELDKFKKDLAPLEDLVANKDKLEGQNTEAKINVKELERVLEQANNIVDNGGKKVTGNNVVSESSNGFIQNIKLVGKTAIVNDLNEEVEPGTEGATLKSVGDGVDEIEILSCNKNLAYNVLYLKTVEYNTCCKSKCFLHPNTNYNISIVVPVGEKFVTETSIFTQRLRIDGDGTRKNLNVTTKNNIKTDDQGYYTIFFNEGGTSSSGNAYGLQIELGNKTSDYIMNKQDKRKLLYKDEDGLWKKPILRKWDTIENHSDKVYYHKKSIELNINGTENWVFDADLGNTIRCYLRNSNLAPGLVVSDKFESIENYRLDKEHIYTSEGTLWVFINKSKATDLNTFKNYLQRVPTTVVCQMIKEEVYECLDISTRSFNPQTLLSVNGGSIDPQVEYYIPSSFVSSDSSISEKLENVDDSLLKLMFDFISHNHDNRYAKLKDFSYDFNDSTDTGFFKLPSGMIIQFGTTKIGFNDNTCIGNAKIYYPLAFTRFCRCTGNLKSNNYGGYNETNAVVGGQTLTNGYAEVRDIQGIARTGCTAEVTWIAIGI